MKEARFERVHVIACAVLKMDLEEAAKHLGIEISMEFLPGGLHSQPRELHSRLQEAIDRVSEEEGIDRIAVGYGVCGMGLIDIHARSIPLAIPRVHDCIALFLGSDEAYRDQFSQYPGTYYISAGWVEGKTQPQSSTAKQGPTDDEFEKLVSKYGTRNAGAIKSFMTSWQKNYQRAAFIDTGIKRKSKYAHIARGMAKEFGWKYEQLSGSPILLTKMLSARETDDDIIIVPPHHITMYAATNRKLKAVPIWQKDKAESKGDQPHRLIIEKDDTACTVSEEEEMQLGLGIDAGGTYTDVAVYNFRSAVVVQKAKALTTKWQFTIGIEEALDKLDHSLLSRVNIVSISTTLATNAIVEGRGQKVGLLVMPPYGWSQLRNFKHDPIALIDGKLDIDGSELAPINSVQVARIVERMIEEEQVQAFAVAGYASHANPIHELQVRQVIESITDVPVTCGHDVSEGLNYRVRAETAALNARIIPCLEALLDDVLVSLRRRKIDAPVMVVKSDGSLTSLPAAREKPVETLLSGPAASVAGAHYLSDQRDAIVVDIGGTTSDVAVIKDGIVLTFNEGARVGDWQTHVNALDMRTLGLGGDSLIVLEKGELTIGPRRVGPISWLMSRYPEGIDAVRWMEHHLGYYYTSTRGIELIALNEYDNHDELSESERRIMDALRRRPCTVDELVHRVDGVAWQLLPLGRLEEMHLIQRCGLTPTDVLHATDRMNLWNGEAAKRMCDLFSDLTYTDRETFAEQVIAYIERKLAVELLKKQLDKEVDPEEMGKSPAAMALVERAFCDSDGEMAVRVRIKKPVIGIGAPAHLFVPGAARLLGTTPVIPTHADVANAIGAITSSVCIHKKVTISIDEKGIFHLKGLAHAPTFRDLDTAEEYAVAELKKSVRDLAIRAGTSQTDIEIAIDDNVGTVADGSSIFVGRVIEARISGRPDVNSMAALT